MTSLSSSTPSRGLAPNETPPLAKRIPKTLETHGDVRVDEYFWLRDKTDPDVLAHLDAENAYTDRLMAGTRELQSALYDEMLGHIKQNDLSAAYRRNGYYYYSRTDEGRQYAVHCRRHGSLDAPEEVVLDLNELAAGKTFLGLGAFEVSDDGERLAYSIDETGYRQYTLYVKDLRTSAMLPACIGFVTGVAWSKDNRSFIYTTEDPITKRADAVWRRELGAAESAPVYRETDELFDVSVNRTRDGAYILITSVAKDTTEVRIIDAGKPAGDARLLRERRDGIRYELDERENLFYVLTNEDAPDFRVFTVPVATPGRAHWTELIGQRPGATITGLELFKDFIAISGRRDGLASIELLRAGSGDVPIPLSFDEADYFVRVGQNADYETATFRFVYESLVTPPSVYDLNVATGERTLVKRIEVPGYDPAAYRAERFFAAAADATEIPVSIVRRADVARDGSAPMLLYAYGSYGYSIDPAFSAPRLALLDRGVVYAVAHVRGGGEYGERWRLAGNLFAKRTTFTDFIDCATGLIAAGYTAPNRLVIQGASAGGLLMGAAINLRPELFAAAIVQVPFVDVLTTMLDASLPLTTGEYREWGNPNERAAYDYMRSYSPVDNIRAQPYPAVLIETAFNDSQVPYWEGVKFGTKLREFTTGDRPIIIKVNLGAGHSGSSGRYDALRERAFDYAFALSRMGITA